MDVELKSLEDKINQFVMLCQRLRSDNHELRQQLADYCAEVNRVDRSVGAVLDLLAKRGFATNTLVVFAGDNGLNAGNLVGGYEKARGS